MASYLTPAAHQRVEIEKIKGSRFIANLWPLTATSASAAQSEVKAHTDALRAIHPDASHHCFAWRLLDDELHSSDDGEPSGTAGKPIANHLMGSGLLCALVVVTRYFGGTKLGTGGLIRAYGAAAKSVLEACEPIERVERVHFTLAYPYELTSSVKAVLSGFDVEELDAEYAAAVKLTISVLLEEADSFARELSERSGGQVEASRLADA